MFFKPTTKFNSTFLSNYFNSLTDPRRTEKGNLQHQMSDILFLTLTGVICGLSEYEDIVYFGKQELAWLQKYSSFANGIPSKDTLRRFFSALDPKSFQSCFFNWVNSLREQDKIDTISIDGKTIRGASTKSVPDSISPHIISALATEQGLCLGQLRVADKTNEITAIPKLLDILFFEKSTVTIDAMGCQSTIVEKIIEKKGNYIIAVKDNQKALARAIKDTVLLERPISTSVIENCGHGRVEKRTCKVYDNLTHLETLDKWLNLKSFVEVESEIFHKSTGKTTKEKRLYISNLESSAKIFNQTVRKHWAIENQLHWVLDVVFKEDSSKKRAGHVAENFNMIYKTALMLINKEKSFKRSKKGKKLGALLDRKYREKIMGL